MRSSRSGVREDRPEASEQGKFSCHACRDAKRSCGELDSPHSSTTKNAGVPDVVVVLICLRILVAQTGDSPVGGEGCHEGR